MEWVFLRERLCTFCLSVGCEARGNENPMKTFVFTQTAGQLALVRVSK